MAAEEKKEKAIQTEDVREYIELLKTLTEAEKNQVKGIMIGMQMTREFAAAFPA